MDHSVLHQRVRERGAHPVVYWIVRAILQVCRDLGIDFIAEGIETYDELRWFCDEGVRLFQGFFFGRPGFEVLPAPHLP